MVNLIDFPAQYFKLILLRWTQMFLISLKKKKSDWVDAIAQLSVGNRPSAASGSNPTHNNGVLNNLYT